MVKIKISNWWLVDAVEGYFDVTLLTNAGTAEEAMEYGLIDKVIYQR